MINSDHFAGYRVMVPAGSATSSAAQYKVPALACTSAYRAMTPVAGVEVDSSSTHSSAFLFAGCQTGKAGYFPALVINGTKSKYPATRFFAGDVIKVYTKVTTTGTTVRVTDVTKGVTKTAHGPIWPACPTGPNVTPWPAGPAAHASAGPGIPQPDTPPPSAACSPRWAPALARDPRQHWHGAAHPPAARPGDVAEGTPEIPGSYQPTAGTFGQFRTDRRTRS